MDLSFEVFLERISTEKKKYECEYSTGEIVLRTEDRERVIATHIPVIEYPNMIQCDEDVINFELHFCLEEKENRKAELEIIVYGLEQHRVEAEREEVEKLINILYKEKWVENRSILTDLFVGYIKFFVRGYLETHYYFLTRCGWKKVGNGREFYSVTKRRGGDFKYIQEMFGEEIYQMYKRGEEFSHILNYFNQCKEFYDLLFENPILIGIFAYTIHALIWDFGCTYEEENYYACTDYVENKDTLFFSICIHGKDIDKAKVIANILCNLFNEPKDSWTVISRLHHVSATSCIPYKDKLNKYSSVPIVVTSKNNHLVKSAKAVTELCRYRKNMKLFIYPVYIK